MHIFFSGIGGGGVGPLALIARQAGYEVSGSDKQASDYTEDLQKKGIQLYIGQSAANIEALHKQKPIDWLVYSSAVSRGASQHPEIVFAQNHGIHHSRRDELLRHIVDDKQLKMIAVAGTHGKSTTTAMLIWLFSRLGVPISYSVGAKIPFGPMGQYVEGSEYFVYECDEFDRNFLAFHPHLSIITGIAWDHHEIFPTKDEYDEAFRTFITQSKHALLWQEEYRTLDLPPSDKLTMIHAQDPMISQITLAGHENRLDAWQAAQAAHQLMRQPLEVLVGYLNTFPGLKQRMEQLAPRLYTNYAHTPEKIRAGMNTAQDIPHKKLIIIYEPLTNRRQHYIKDEYKDCFAGADKLYWVPSYLAREDPDLPLLQPSELIPYLSNAAIAEPAELNDALIATIKDHLHNGHMVVAMGASGAGSLDAWLRANLEQLNA